MWRHRHSLASSLRTAHPRCGRIGILAVAGAVFAATTLLRTENVVAQAAQAAPDTTIVRSKVRPRHDRAKYWFHSSEAGSSFQCRLGHQRFRRCDSPKVYRRLKERRYVFAVRAVNSEGIADPTPEKRRLRIGGGPGPPFPPLQHIEPARMLDQQACEFISPEVFVPTNGWRVGNRIRSTIVCAGAAGVDDESTGRFVLLRINDRWGTQRLTHIDVPDAGTLTITEAPLGREVVTSAQRRGLLHFTGERGVSGTLRLSDDSVIFDSP